MTTLRRDARRAREARRERTFATPAPLLMPMAWTLSVVAGTTVLLVLLGAGAATVVCATTAELFVAALAARRTLASVAAGVALWMIRPYRGQERVRLDSPEQGGPVEADVVRIGLVNSTLRTEDDLLVVANTRLLGVNRH